ncbi:MAG: hypothetical protein AAF465_17350 [Pseudomonadota bacterium]
MRLDLGVHASSAHHNKGFNASSRQHWGVLKNGVHTEESVIALLRLMGSNHVDSALRINLPQTVIWRLSKR